MRFERIHLMMFLASMLLALVYGAHEVVPGWKAALIIGGHGLMFLILGHRGRATV